MWQRLTSPPLFNDLLFSRESRSVGQRRLKMQYLHVDALNAVLAVAILKVREWEAVCWVLVLEW